MPGKMNNGVPVEALGARKKKVFKKGPKRGLHSYAKAVARYLVSDTYMYAPLVEVNAANRCVSPFVSTPPSASGVSRLPLSTETIQKLGAKISAKRVLYEEFVK